MSKPLSPASSSVGTSGSTDERFAVVTASARSLPAWMCGSTGVMVSKDIVDLAAEQVGGQRAAALVGHVQHLDAGARSGTACRSGAARCRCRSSRRPASLRRRLGEAPPVPPPSARRRQRGVDDQHVGHHRHGGDRHEVLLEVVGQLLVDAGARWCGAPRPSAACSRRAWPWRRSRRPAWRRRRAGSRPPPAGPGSCDSAVGQRARQHVGRAARRERHDQADRACGPGLRQGQRGRQAERERRGLHELPTMRPEGNAHGVVSVLL